jgi:hypothetical protein
MEGEPREPRRPAWDAAPRAPVEDPGAAELVPGQARRIIEDGIRIAEGAGQTVDDWVARHIAVALRDEAGSALDLFARSGEIDAELRPELIRGSLKLPRRQQWIQSLHDYADYRADHGPVEGWVQRAARRDQFHAAWWDHNRERGNRYQEAGELDREIRLAQEARQVIRDELVMRLLVRLAPNPHTAIARFAADGSVTDELSLELQDRYLSGTEQERRWLHELGSWIAARGEPSPLPWWRTPASVASAATERADPTDEGAHRATRLADLDERLAPLPDLGDIPRLPQGHRFGNGYEWMHEGLPEGWHPEPIWGRAGWDLGAWPLVIVALYIDDERESYAVATYVEGDVDVRRYKSRGALYVAVNEIAEFHWRLGQAHGPRDLPEGGGLLPHHTGPYPGWSEAREAELQRHHRDGQNLPGEVDGQ